jgi:hypothetical protein
MGTILIQNRELYRMSAKKISTNYDRLHLLVHFDLQCSNFTVNVGHRLHIFSYAF